MILACGVTREEIKESNWVSCDLLVDGGTTDIQLNIHEMSTWNYILTKYGEKSFETIFFDGGMYDKFSNVQEKSDTVDIVQKLCTKGVIKYGTHMLLRGKIKDVAFCNDPLDRGYNLPFTYIPIEMYTMANMNKVFRGLLRATTYRSIRMRMEFCQCF